MLVFLVAARGGDDDRTVSSDAASATAGAGSSRTVPGAATDASGLTAPATGSNAEPVARPTATPTPRPRTLAELPVDGPGTFTYAAAAAEPIGAAPYMRFNVATEDGIGVAADDVAAIVDSILSDPRSWIGDGVTGFRRVGAGEDVTFTLVVAAPTTVDALCVPLNTAGRYSCGRNGWIALNLHRWETGAEVWPSTIDVYREYLVNHEVGHYLLGSFHDNVCPVPGGPAPIMMQQSILLDGCRPNGWVYPTDD